MFWSHLVLFLCVLHSSLCNWVSEWMSPIREQFKKTGSRRNEFTFQNMNFDDESLGLMHVMGTTESPQGLSAYSRGNVPISALKIKLESTLQSARVLAESLKLQIEDIGAQEAMLKDAIANGRTGMTTVTVTSLGKAPRTYIIRDGFWTSCGGILQYPMHNQSPNFFGEAANTPKCIGREVMAEPDPCVFNSIIKYETVPVTRRLEYMEDDYLCLKKSFNNTLERYLSVPRQVINKTCLNGIVRSLEENIAKCGLRVMSEYNYYPERGYEFTSRLPLEYCDEPDGSCKLIIAWHVSNATIENFEFLKNEQDFKKFFIKPSSYIEHII